MAACSVWSNPGPEPFRMKPRSHEFRAVLQSGCPMVQMNCVDLRTILRTMAAALMIGGLVSCRENNSGPAPSPEAKASQTATQVFAVKGVVKELQPDGRTIVIKHEKIADYM